MKTRKRQSKTQPLMKNGYQDEQDAFCGTNNNNSGDQYDVLRKAAFQSFRNSNYGCRD